MKKLIKTFKNKKVLITGFNGFKGTWLTLWISLLGGKVYGISLKSNDKFNHYNLVRKKLSVTEKYIDINNQKKLIFYIQKIKPDYVFHLAAQSLVFKSIKDPLTNWQTNVIGFLNILMGLNKLKKRCVAVLITSDKCYKNLNRRISYKETDELGGLDPYSASKASSEILFKSFFNTYIKDKNKKLRICSARAGNVIGGGDWSEKRLVPDCMKKWLLNENPEIRNPKSTRPWQHVLEAIYGYLKLAQILSENKKLNGESFNFSSNKIKNISVQHFLKKIKSKWPTIKWKIKSKNNFYESDLLQLNSSKAKKYLKWDANLNFNETIELLVDWYKKFKKNKKKIFLTSIKQIEFYSSKLK